jgi:aryl-alcohol dehydrogenase-like predicted oxidoreductase
MKFRPLGSSGVQVSTFALGAMMFGRIGNSDFEQCAHIVNRALDAGINVIDTADFYSLGESEQILGRALASRRCEVILASKCFWPMSETDPNRRGGSRRWILQACEESLSRLRTDYLDIYYLHKFDILTDLDESLGAMSDLVRLGKVRMVGISTFPPDRIVEAVWTAERRGHVRPRVEQPPYSILNRHIERDLLPACERFGLGVMVWGPLNGGYLTGKYRKHPFDVDSRASRCHEVVATAFDRSRPQVVHKLHAIERLSKLADEAGISLAHLALAFATEHPAVTSAIIGPRTLQQLDDLLPAANIKLTSDLLDRIDEIVAPGTDIDPVTDAGWTPPWIEDASKRRRQGLLT